MKKFALILFLLVDALVMASASIFLFYYVQGKPLPIPESLMPIRLPTRSMPVTRVSTPSAPLPISATPVVSSGPVSASPVPTIAPAIPANTPSGLRNLRFMYKNSRAKEVSIRADFTGWRAKPMVRDALGVWTYDAQLAPGEYAYCYAVDNKIIPDPASKRSKQIGQNKVSAIEVKPAPAK